MNFFDSSKSLVENLYYISGVLILISVIIGLIQISIAKKTLKINSRRDAACLAANQIEIYTTHIIPLINKVFHQELDKSVKMFELEVGEFNKQALVSKLGEKEVDAGVLERLKVMQPILNAINSMESFSVYFIKEVADEEIAFSSVGRTFTKTVESYYFDLCYIIGDDNDKSFQNLIKLYKIWSVRLEKENLEKHQKKLLDQLKSMKPEVNIKPIGT